MRFAEIHGFAMRAVCLGGFISVEGSTGSVIELFATNALEVVVDTVIGGESFLTPHTLWVSE